jgi:hypothetical protein
MERNSVDHDQHSCDCDQHRAGDLSNGNECREGRASVRSVLDGRVLESRTPGFHGALRREADPEADAGFVTCTSCHGDPEQYLIDYEEVCDCNGRGYFIDPDYEPEFHSDPYSEFSTMPRLHGRGRGQL